MCSRLRWRWRLGVYMQFLTIHHSQCKRTYERNNPDQRGTKKGWLAKYSLGGFAFLAITLIVWGPLAIFVINASTTMQSVPTEVQMSLYFDSFPPLYDSSSEPIRT